MAYKFQLGKAKLSGSIETAQAITSQGGLTVNGDVDLDAGVINNSELQNSSVMFNGVTVALGATGSFGTDAVAEGSSNLYYTDARVRAAVSAGVGLDYDSATGAFSVGTGEITNSMLSGAIASSKLAELNSFDTGDLAEGSNLYYTDARARAAVSVNDVSGDGSLTYDSGSGVITYTGPSASEVRAHLSAGDGLKFAGGEFAVSSSIAGAGLAWNAGVLSVDTAEIAAGLSGSVRDIVADFVEGSDFVTFDDATGTIGVSGAAFTGSARSVLSVSDAGGDGSLSYNASTGVLTYTGPSASEVRAHLSAVDAGGDGSFSYDSATGAFTYTGPSAAEARAHFSTGDFLTYNSGSGLFSVNFSAFTSSARSVVSVSDAGGDGSLSYNASTGVITYTGPSSAEVRAHLNAGPGLAYNSGTGQFSIELGKVTNSMLSGAISNDKLVNSSVTVVAGDGLVGGGAVALGSSITLSASVDSNALEIVADQIALKSTISGDRTFANNVVVSGDLTVNGTTTYINTDNLVVEDAIITIASGSAFMAGIGIELGTQHSLQTATGIADVSGGNALSSSLPLVAPEMKAASFYGNLVGSMQLSVETKSANATISKNVTRATANITLTLPSSPVVGQEHRVKCFVDDLSSPAVVVAAQSGATIEGIASITLESYGAGVSLVWDGSAWMIF